MNEQDWGAALARVEALADKWDTHRVGSHFAAQLRAALNPRARRSTYGGRMNEQAGGTQPENQLGRCPSIDPHDTLQCERRVHGDDQCQFGGIAWRKGTPRYISDREWADSLEAGVEAMAERWGDHPVARELRALLAGGGARPSADA